MALLAVIVIDGVDNFVGFFRDLPDGAANQVSRCVWCDANPLSLA